MNTAAPTHAPVFAELLELPLDSFGGRSLLVSKGLQPAAKDLRGLADVFAGDGEDSSLSLRKIKTVEASTYEDEDGLFLRIEVLADFHRIDPFDGKGFLSTESFVLWVPESSDDPIEIQDFEESGMVIPVPSSALEPLLDRYGL